METEKAKWSKTWLKLSHSESNSRCLKNPIVYGNTEWLGDVLNVHLKHLPFKADTQSQSSLLVH